MKNQNLAQIFHEISIYLEMEEVAFKPQAYEKAAVSLETSEDEVEDIYRKEGFKGLLKIPGVGESIAEKIEEYLKTGKIKYYEDFRRKTPVDINELIAVEGIGPKIVKELYQKLKIKNLEDLEKAAKEGKIRKLSNFGEKKEKNILQGIEFVKRSKGRFLLGNILPDVKIILDRLKILKEVDELSVAGSIRRMKETIGDVDILVVSSDSKKVSDFFLSFPEIVKVWGRGATKVSVRMKEGFDVDIRFIPEDDYGAALQYFTGSKDHNIATRKIAIDKGLKLSEYGVFNGKKKVASRTEEEVYKMLGMRYIEPELRENSGEIEAALEGKLPELVGYKDIKGDFHVHTNWARAANSIEEIIEKAKKMGYEYVGISDHTKFLHIENGLDENKLLLQRKYIKDLNKKLDDFVVLQGCEANIMADGSIDIEDKILEQLDYVIAGVHSQMKMGREEMTERIVRAMKNPNVDIISHPTG